MVTRLAILMGALALAQAARGQSVLEQMEREVTDIVRTARSGVVSIEDERAILQTPPVERIAGGKQPDLKGAKQIAIPNKDGKSGAQAAPPKSGSGFSIGDGLIVTTADVLEGMQNPTVLTESGVRFRAFTVRIDPELNIGLLRLPPKSDAPALPLGDSSQLAVGQFAITIGNQSGQPNAVALAVVSGIKHEGVFAAGHFYPDLIQIAGTVAPGSSGAPLLNRKGEVVGMMAAVPAAEPAGTKWDGDSGGHAFRPSVSSAGYAIPIDDLRATIHAMREAKLYARAWVGIDLKELARKEGDGRIVRVVKSVRIAGLYPDSPAARAGLRMGDTINGLNGAPIHTLADFRTAVVRLQPGQSLKLAIERDGRPIDVVIPFQMRPPTAGKP